MPVRWHVDDPVLLGEAIEFTSAQTGFLPRMIEKDYFCSVILEYLATQDDSLIFKGGTCLAKIHTEFYRLSEDLDFSISTPLDASRANRRTLSKRFKEAVDVLPEALPGFRVVESLRGANFSSQYKAVIGYESLLDAHVEPVSIEIGLREPLMDKPYSGKSKTVVRNPIDREALVDAYPVQSFTYLETMAEKLRAALCRREVAIRDYFDVDYAVHHADFNVQGRDFLDLLKRKLAVPDTAAVDVSPERVDQLERQVEAQLRPVLREREYAAFDLERAIQTVSGVAAVVS